jgi:acetyl esterase/lipase
MFDAAHGPLAPGLPAYIEAPTDAAAVFGICPDTGIPPDSVQWMWHEQTMQVPLGGGTTLTTMVRNVVIPTVTMFRPVEGTANGASLIVAPGGAFRFLMMEHEGYDLARQLTPLGVTVFVLRYRLAHTPESDAEMRAYLDVLPQELPLQGRTAEAPPVGNDASEAARPWAKEDGRQAIRFVREHAAAWGLDRQRIGIAGFSAGGGVAMGAVMEHDAQSRPDFAVGIYPSYRTATPAPEDAPPLFLAIADDDVLVGPVSIARLYEAWHKAGKPVELHIFANGAHGFGTTQQKLLSDQWFELFCQWPAAQGYFRQQDSY